MKSLVTLARTCGNNCTAKSSENAVKSNPDTSRDRLGRQIRRSIGHVQRLKPSRFVRSLCVLESQAGEVAFLRRGLTNLDVLRRSRLPCG